MTRHAQVLLGAPDGRLQIWNLRSGTLVHESSKFGKSGGSYASAVMALEQSTALDVVGVGFANGRIALHNLKFDETVVTFSHELDDAVRALAFKSDGEPILVSCGAHGTIHVWVPRWKHSNTRSGGTLTHLVARTRWRVTAGTRWRVTAGTRWRVTAGTRAIVAGSRHVTMGYVTAGLRNGWVT